LVSISAIISYKTTETFFVTKVSSSFFSAIHPKPTNGY
jgi:hypothetical protein